MDRRERAAGGDTISRVTEFDDRRLGASSDGWPVDVPPFRDERFRSPWHWIQYVAMRASQRSVLALPRPLREAVVRSVACLGRTFDRRHTRAAEEFIRAAMPEANDAEVKAQVREAWRHMLRVALVSEGVTRKVQGNRLGDHYDVWASDDALELVRSGDPTVVVCAHAGYWEAMCPGMVGAGYDHSYAIGKAPRNDYVAQWVQHMRESQGMRLIPRKGAMSAVPAALRAGSAVAMFLDHRPRQKPVYAPFFGRDAACDRSAGVLIRRLKAPLLFLGCYGRPGENPLNTWRFELRLTRVIRPDELAGLDPAGIAARVNRELEELILHRPDEVFWLHDRFKEPADRRATSPKRRTVSSDPS